MASTKEDVLNQAQLISQLSQQIEELKLSRTHPNNLTWDNKMVTTGSIKFDDGEQYKGTFYTTEANQGTLAIHMENGHSSKPGTMTIGVKLENNKNIITLARIHKTENHAFYLREAISNPPSIYYGVVKTPENYDEKPSKFLGFPQHHASVINFNCDPDDHWIEPDNNTVNVLNRSHSPTPSGSHAYDFKWNNQMTTEGSLTLNDEEYEGTFYKTEANKGKLAIRMENGRSSKPGTMTIGVTLGNNKEIITLARIHKTENHAFYISKAVFNPPSILLLYGVVRTPENYDEKPNQSLGYPGFEAPVIQINCSDDNRWIEPDRNLLERSHSPTKQRKK